MDLAAAGTKNVGNDAAILVELGLLKARTKPCRAYEGIVVCGVTCGNQQASNDIRRTSRRPSMDPSPLYASCSTSKRERNGPPGPV